MLGFLFLGFVLMQNCKNHPNNNYLGKFSVRICLSRCFHHKVFIQIESSYVRNSIPFLFSVSSPLQTVRLPSSPELLAPSCFLARLYPLTYGLPDRLLFFMPQSCFKRTSFFRSRSFKSVSTFLVSTISERSEVRHTPDCVTCSNPASSDIAYCHCSLCLHDNFFGRCHSYFSSANLAQAVYGKYLSVPLSVSRRYSCTNLTAAFRIFFLTARA